MSLANEELWREGQLTSYAALLSPLLPSSGWGLRITGSKFLMLTSPFLPKPFLQKTEEGASQSKEVPAARVSPNIGVPPEGQWEGSLEEGAEEEWRE